MKFCLLAIGVIFLQSCTNEESVSDKFRAETTQGAILRTIKVNQATFNYFDPTAKWSVTVEEQDNANGSLLAEVKVYAQQTTGGVTKPEKFLKTFPANVFTKGVNGYPTATLTASLAETLTALGLTTGQYTPSDKIQMRLVLVLTDGRTFTYTHASGTITGGVYFSSPFRYSVQFFCPIADASMFNGNFKVTYDAWEDYAAGDIIPVVYDPAFGTLKFKLMSTNNPYIINWNTSYMIVTINPVNGAVTITSNEPFNYGGGFLVPVTGTGSVGSCTGDINLKVNFGPYTNYGLSLVKI